MTLTTVSPKRPLGKAKKDLMKAFNELELRIILRVIFASNAFNVFMKSVFAHSAKVTVTFFSGRSDHDLFIDLYFRFQIFFGYNV